jgi:RNA ligase (TIGR02306 family)
VNRDQWKVGDLCVFIEPDSVLPDKEWAKFYKSKSSRVRAIRLRGSWSFGIIETAENTEYRTLLNANPMQEGLDITDIIGITKYEPPIPQDLNAAGPYALGIPKTDECRWQSLDQIPYGELCDVTLKIDGQSFSAFCKLHEDHVNSIEEGIGGRSFIYKLDSQNNYTQNQANYDVLNKLNHFCRKNKISLCIRGEQYGHGIQKFSINPHAKRNLGLAFYSTWLIDEHRYARKGEPYYIHNFAHDIGLETVPILEKDVILTPELIKKYDEELETVFGSVFEGVVIQTPTMSFKVISKFYDSKK